MDHIRFPIGQFEPILTISDSSRTNIIHQIPDITKRLRSLTEKLGSEQLNISYRHKGWTIKQIVHHLADNDMNAYLRFKRALTEDEPIASSYREDLWAEQSDYMNIPLENSDIALQRFVWHNWHHIAQIEALLKKEGWYLEPMEGSSLHT